MSQKLDRIRFLKRFAYPNLTHDEIQQKINAFDEFERQRHESVLFIDAQRNKRLLVKESVKKSKVKVLK